MLRSLSTLRSVLSLRSSGVLLSVLLLVLSLVASLFSPLVASAASPYDTSFKSTQTLTVQTKDGLLDITSNWVEYFRYAAQRRGLTEHVNLFDQNLAAGSGWAVQNTRDSKSFRLILFNPNATVSLATSQYGQHYLEFSQSENVLVYEVDGASWIDFRMDPAASPAYWNYANFVYNLPTGDSSYTWFDATSPYLFIASDNVQYPAGYEGATIPSSANIEPTPTISPDIEYVVKNKKVTLKYMGNIQHQSCPVMNWTTYKQGAEDSPVDQKLDQPPQNDYSFTVTEYGKYVFIADLHVPVPCAPFPDDYEVVPTIITLDVDGSSFEGSNSDLICEVRPDGYMGCVTPDATSCNLEETFIEQMSCRFNKSVSMGLINPTINAFKDVLSSFIVVSPTCQIIIQDVAILPGQSFPLSDYSGYACDSAAEFREAFPIAPILLNFFLAITQLYLVVMMINRLLNHEKNDIIEGVA